MKVNSLTDDELIDELYAASQAGVEIDLIIRGDLRLRPGVKGLVGEYSGAFGRRPVSRAQPHILFCERRRRETRKFISAVPTGCMRNLDRRVEVVVPIIDPAIRTYLKEEILDVYLKGQCELADR